MEIGRTWVRSTVLICDGPLDEGPDFGTGFLVCPNLTGRGEGRQAVLLVTNKHVLHPDDDARATLDELFLYFQKKDQDPTLGPEENLTFVQFTFDASRESGPIREHPDPNVDVAVIDVTPLAIEFGDLATLAPRREHMAFTTHGIDAGEHLFVLGYPAVSSVHGDAPVPLTSGNILRPIVKWAIAATSPSHDFHDVSQGRAYRGFLIDGMTLHGMSGSPVYTAEPRYTGIVPGATLADYDLSGMTPAPPYLVGIVAETRFVRAPDNPYVTLYSGLGLAFNTDVVWETIELFEYYDFDG